MDQPTDPRRQGRCPGTNRRGKPCGNAAGHATDHPGVGLCANHTGSTPNGRKHAQRLIAEQGVVTYGLPRDVDPHDALVEEIARTAGHVDWLRTQIEQMDPDALVRGVVSIKESQDQQGARTGRETTVGSVPAVWLALYHKERRHLVEVCRVAIAAGVEERRVRVAEQTGELIATVIRATLQDLGVPDTPETFAVVARHLRLAG